MFSKDVIKEITEMAAEHGIEPAALLAVAEVESGGKVFAVVQGRREPLIRFEGHYFDRRLAADKQARARAEGLAAPEAGAVANPASQAARWRLLERAARIDRKAAYESTSWGIGQVMGAHWTWLGYASAEAMVEEARSGAAGQLRLMLRYIEKAGLADALRRRDWEAFARGYNGPAFRRNGYHTKIARAYARHGGSGAAAPAPAPRHGALLGRGSRGEAVRDLQTMLSSLGYPLSADGIFGPATERAVKRFQRDHEIGIDGIVGPATRRAMAKAMPFGTAKGGVWARLLSFAAFLLGRFR